MTYTTCPKCEYTRRPDEESPPDTCPACGIVFSKWEKYQATASDRDERRPAVVVYDRDPESPWRELLLGSAETDSLTWYGRAATLVGLFILGGWFFIHGPNDYEALLASFLHRVDLIFHEAGHVIFMPFGEFLCILGGTLGQLLIPLIVMLAFLRQGNPFGAAVGLWWIGQSCMDVAIYMNDARALQMPLLGGGTGYDDPGRHDWNNLFTWTGLLKRDQAIAGFTYMLGRLAMLVAWGWGLALLKRQWGGMRESGMS